MELKYEQLFSINVRPEYYTDDRPHNDLLIKPTGNCNNLMSRYKILSKTTFNGISLYYQCDPAQVGAVALRPVLTEEKFTFILKSGNADFWYYADVQNWASETIYLLTNPNFNTTGDITVLNGPLINPMPFYPMQFKYAVSLENVGGLLEVINNGSVLKTISVRAKSAAEPANASEFYLIDLRGYADGQYTIRHINTAGNHDETVYCSADFSLDALAVIEIKYKGGAAYTGVAPFQNYIVNISSRKTDWYYDVYIRQKPVPLTVASKLLLKHIPVPPETTKTFTVSSGPDDVNGYVQFKSSVKLSYSQIPMHLQLNKTTATGPEPVIDPLPLPSAIDVQKDAANQLFTKVIINV